MPNNDDLVYTRVIPRDLFNEANLLKCLGLLALLHLERLTPEGLEIDNDGLPVDVEMDPSDGSLRGRNVRCAITKLGAREIEGRDQVDLFRPLNSREPFPLWARFDDADVPVFDDGGDLTAEFKGRCL